MAKGASAEQAVREIRRKTRRRFSAEEKVRIVLEGLRGRRRGAAPNGEADLVPGLGARPRGKGLREPSG
jgi:hypothetical protein